MGPAIQRFGPTNFTSGLGCLIWIICALLMVLWICSAMKYCMEFAEAPYQPQKKTHVERRIIRDTNGKV